MPSDRGHPPKGIPQTWVKTLSPPSPGGILGLGTHVHPHGVRAIAVHMIMKQLLISDIQKWFNCYVCPHPKNSLSLKRGIFYLPNKSAKSKT